jgi:hypothetical protein
VQNEVNGLVGNDARDVVSRTTLRGLWGFGRGGRSREMRDEASRLVSGEPDRTHSVCWCALCALAWPEDEVNWQSAVCGRLGMLVAGGH